MAMPCLPSVGLMPSCRREKKGGSSMILKNRPITRHYQMLQKITKTSKTAVAGMADDNVVENFDFQKLTRSDEIAGDLDIRLGWSRITARMIVANDDCGCTCHDCQSENFAGMTKDRIHRSNGHQVVPFDATTSVEDEHHQTFTFRIEVRMIGDMRFPIGGCLIRCFALLHGVGCRTFSK